MQNNKLSEKLLLTYVSVSRLEDIAHALKIPVSEIMKVTEEGIYIGTMSEKSMFTYYGNNSVSSSPIMEEHL